MGCNVQNGQGIKIDIGCGRFKKKGFVGVDMLPTPGVDYVVDLRKEGLPFADNSVDEVFTNHFLEHLEIEDVVKVMEDIHRVYRVGAKVEIRVPHFSGYTNFYEFHKTSFRYNSFREFIDGEEGMFRSQARFELLQKRICLGKSRYFPWNYVVEPLINWGKMPIVYERTFLRNLFPASEIAFILEVIK